MKLKKWIIATTNVAIIAIVLGAGLLSLVTNKRTVIIGTVKCIDLNGNNRSELLRVQINNPTDYQLELVNVGLLTSYDINESNVTVLERW